MEKTTNLTRNPWWWIPTLYFAEGIPYIIVNTISVILFKKMGLGNADVALYTSLLYLPWVIKPLWSPFVDVLKTKRWWIVTMQILMAAAFFLLAL
ncbi:MAG: MFS transporter, partial [Bacteroidales bacterium]|nr:MFS transporter [Bacteroidales bacterium]